MFGAVMRVMVKIWPAAMFSLPKKYVFLHLPFSIAYSSLIQQIYFLLYAHSESLQMILSLSSLNNRSFLRKV